MGTISVGSSCFPAAAARVFSTPNYFHCHFHVRASLTTKFHASPQGLSDRACSRELPYPSRNGTIKLINSRTLRAPFICRADLGSSIAQLRLGNRLETDKLASSVRDKTMKAVDALGARVTIGDVASKAGLKLSEAEKALQALAADSGGFLEVSDEGDVLYVFPRDYRTKLAAKSLRLRLEPVLDKTKAVAEYLIRVSFGTALLASIAIVYTAIIAILSGRSEDDNRGRRGRSYDNPGLGRSYNSGFNIFISPADLFWYWDPYYYRRRRRKEGGGMNFFESIFSFVFGDGDPNQDIEEERWKLIGEYIALHGGVVTAEELAPYLDVPPVDEDQDDESYVLPVLLQFDGRPEVDSKGNILYHFPSLQRTASMQSRRKEYVGKRWKSWIGEATKFLQERRWDFSKAGGTEKAMVIALGGLNLAGVIVLGSMLKEIGIMRGGFLSFVVNIFPLLQIYAGSFFVIPLTRWFLIQKKNADIEKRNRARQQRALALQAPNPSLRWKIESARDMAEQTVIGQDRIIYSTEKDVSEQNYDSKDWERRFRELERSD